ncbi:MAG TPA: hypothetical protein VNX40_04350, partial [Mucilaginibacter sp.]|nr:hypothetical protein [Mucilaginibacter sp.]
QPRRVPYLRHGIFAFFFSTNIRPRWGRWSKIPNARFTVDDTMERAATDEEQQSVIDLADGWIGGGHFFTIN